MKGPVFLLVLGQTVLDAADDAILPDYEVLGRLSQSDERFGPQLVDCLIQFRLVFEVDVELDFGDEIPFGCR
jgi:hypothetical protein